MMLRHTGTFRAPARKTDWSGFEEFLRSWIPSHTVPQLRSFASALVTYGRREPFVRSGDRKADVIQKIQEAFMALKARMDLDAYVEARYHCEVTVGGGWDPFPRTSTTTLVPPAPPVRTHPSVQPPPPPTFGDVPRWSSGAASVNSSGSGLNGYRSTSGSASSSVAYGNISAHASSSTPTHGPQHVLQDWKINPMWKPLRAITSMETLPDISANESHSTYRAKRTQFVLPNDVIEKLKVSRESPKTSPHYSLRLFCTSSDHYRPTSVYARHLPASTNIPIEYPGNPEVSIDGTVLPFKEKGLRGKAGSAPPFDLDKPINNGVTVGGRVALVPGRLMSVNIGHRGPTTGKNKNQSKRFFFQIVFAEMTTKEELLAKLNNLEPTKAEDAIEQLRRKQEDDDDIVAGTASMSLKDPLSYMRMTRPIRSSKCGHIQCFDATWWIESNAVHPQWLCPHCSKELRFDDLIVDGYVMDILKAVPDTVDDVILEPTGEWHTEDNKYGTASWLASHAKTSSATAASTPIAPSAPASCSSEIETKPSVNDMNGTSGGDGANRGVAGLKRKVVQVIDSDDERDGTPAKSSVPPAGRVAALGSSSSVNGSRTGASTPIIDLTLSDSDDETDEESGPATSSRVPPAPIQVPRTTTAAGAIVSPKRPVSAAGTHFHSLRETTSDRLRSPSACSWHGLSSTGIGDVSGRSSPLSHINGQASTSASGSAITSHLQPPSDQYPPISPSHFTDPPSQTILASPRIAALPPPSHIFPSFPPSPASTAPAAPLPHVLPARPFSRPDWVNPLGPSSSSEISSSTYASMMSPSDNRGSERESSGSRY
ncbi:E3 SUMO-protein ligase PIAS1 [Cryptococcus gattii Ru294]|nr:E3 SUMO-protein ligase PIAS1 [Cryptococcus gattii Ru294]